VVDLRTIRPFKITRIEMPHWSPETRCTVNRTARCSDEESVRQGHRDKHRAPEEVLAIGFVSTLLLSSMAMFLEFDNSQDAFFPDNETVQLLDEVESEYQASIDFVR